MSKYERLRELSGDDIEYFNLDGKNCIGKICHVNNASSCIALLLLNNIVLKFNCSLINLPVISDDEGKMILIHQTMDIPLLGVELDDEIYRLEKSNTKLINIKCGKFDNKGNLQVLLYNLNDDTCSINDIIREKLNIYQ